MLCYELVKSLICDAIFVTLIEAPLPPDIFYLRVLYRRRILLFLFGHGSSCVNGVFNLSDRRFAIWEQ
jgi:hypothetical protein